MGATKAVTSATLADIAPSLRQVLQPGARVCVALSGGMDSVVLLHGLTQLRSVLNLQLTAVHVHHGLSQHANAWRDFCRGLCRGLAVPCSVHSVAVADDSGEGIEAAARAARYRIFFDIDTDYLALAHHRDDQAETLLLQLLRGAGVKGLSGMPMLRPLPNGRSFLFRPLLDVERSTLLDWARRHHLQWVDDDSNTNMHYARNFLRHRVLPLVGEQHPAWRSTLARSARHLADAALLLDELAAQDGRGAWLENRLRCDRLAELSPPRARNLLRYFLAQQHISMPSEAQLAQIVQQLLQARRDAAVDVRLGQADIRRFAGQAWVVRRMSLPNVPMNRGWEPLPLIFDLAANEVSTQGFMQETDLPALSGVLRVRATLGQGMAVTRTQHATIRLRQGGERLKPDAKRPARSLKYLWQEAKIPPWQREQWPLVYVGETLVCIPGIGVACDWQVQAGEPGWLLEWLPAS